nr:carbohydrate ABC transporter permease [Aquibacillus saliphilus]
MASFVIARFNFKINKYLLLFFLLGMMIPMHSVLVPVAYVIGVLGLKNNLVALVLIYVAFLLPFTIIVLTRFMKSVSPSLEEAAIMDGASYFQVYYKIMLPMTVPAISTVSIFNFLASWNDILFPLMFINDDRLKPVALGLLNFSGERASEYGPLMAAITIVILIPLIVYLLFQEKVESGLAAGSVKG